MEEPKCCDNCKFYEWYYDKCKNFNCEVDARHLCSMYQEREELSEYQRYILSQMANSDAKTIEEIGLMYQKQLAEIIQQQNFYIAPMPHLEPNNCGNYVVQQESIPVKLNIIEVKEHKSDFSDLDNCCEECPSCSLDDGECCRKLFEDSFNDNLDM